MRKRKIVIFGKGVAYLSGGRRKTLCRRGGIM
jgi:hypothetical protein